MVTGFLMAKLNFFNITIFRIVYLREKFELEVLNTAGSIGLVIIS